MRRAAACRDFLHSNQRAPVDVCWGYGVNALLPATATIRHKTCRCLCCKAAVLIFSIYLFLLAHDQPSVDPSSPSAHPTHAPTPTNPRAPCRIASFSSCRLDLQGVLGAGTPPPRNSDASKPSSSFKVPGFGGGGGGGSSNNSKNSKANHFRGDARATSSSSFTGVMQALLKPTRGSASAAAAAKAESPERPQPTFRPRSALDLSGHSFSKTMKVCLVILSA